MNADQHPTWQGVGCPTPPRRSRWALQATAAAAERSGRCGKCGGKCEARCGAVAARPAARSPRRRALECADWHPPPVPVPPTLHSQSLLAPPPPLPLPQPGCGQRRPHFLWPRVAVRQRATRGGVGVESVARAGVAARPKLQQLGGRATAVGGKQPLLHPPPPPCALPPHVLLLRALQPPVPQLSAHAVPHERPDQTPRL